MKNENKPISIVRDEVAQEIINTINNSGLPLFIVEYIVSEILQQVHNTREEEEAKIKKEYEEKNKKD